MRVTLLRAAAIAAIWPVLGLASLTSSSLTGTVTAAIPTFLDLLKWLEWSVLSFPIVWLAGRHPLWQRVTGRRLVAHAAAAVLLACLHLAIFLLVVAALQDHAGSELAELAARRLPRHLFFGVMFYFFISSVAQALASREAMRQDAARAERRQRELAHTSLAGAIAGVQSEWFLSALASAEQLLPTDPERAAAIVYRLADSLRLVLERMRTDSVPAELDIALARAWLAVESLRSGVTIELRAEIEPAARGFSLASGIVETLVGALASEVNAPCRVDLRITAEEGRLRVHATSDNPSAAMGRLVSLLAPLGDDWALSTGDETAAPSIHLSFPPPVALKAVS